MAETRSGSLTRDFEGAAGLAAANVRMIAVDMDGTLLGGDGRVSARNLAAVKAAEAAGVEVVVATGRRHCYAMRVLRGLGLGEETVLISANGTVTRTLRSRLLDRTLLPVATARWLCAHLDEFRNALVMTFDRVGPDGEDERGALVVEHMEDLSRSVGRWIEANEPYIAHVRPIEDALEGGAPIQMMVCGTVERMRRAEARLMEHEAVLGVGMELPGTLARVHGAEVALHRTEYAERDLSILDILPAGCSKGEALLRLGRERGVLPAEMLAIGDNWNDVSMLEVAGRAVLMDNAPEDLKAMGVGRGWEIGEHHARDGVAEAVEAVLRGGRRG